MTTVLKLGGSVVTEKERERTVDERALDRIATTLTGTTEPLLVVIGGGSFGHPAAASHGVSAEAGTRDPAAVAAVHSAMLDLVTTVVDRFVEADLPAVAFHPLSLATRDADGLTIAFDAVDAALAEGFVPVLHGDGVVTADRGVTILSGDDIVVEAARQFDADRLGLCTGVDGVLDTDGEVIDRIDRFDAVASAVGESDATDVTGGMAGKVRSLLAVGTPASVFGLDGLQAFLEGGEPGTTIGSVTHRRRE